MSNVSDNNNYLRDKSLSTENIKLLEKKLNELFHHYHLEEFVSCDKCILPKEYIVPLLELLCLIKYFQIYFMATNRYNTKIGTCILRILEILNCIKEKKRRKIYQSINVFKYFDINGVFISPNDRVIILNYSQQTNEIKHDEVFLSEEETKRIYELKKYLDNYYN